MLRPGIEPMTSCSPERTLYLLSLCSIVITSLRGEGAGRCDVCLSVCPCFALSCLTILPLCAAGGLHFFILALPWDLFLFFNTQVESYMPYLALWDKISQNLDHLEANNHKIFQIPLNFQTILQRMLWRNKHKSHLVVFITRFLHLNKRLLTILGALQSDFCKNLSELYQISRKNLPYLTDFSPQHMACM